MKLFIILLFCLISLLYIGSNSRFSFSDPFVYDPSLKVEKVYEGLHFPVSMSFLAPDDIIVLEKNEGTVNRIVNGQIQDDPILKLNVEIYGESGLVGSAVLPNSTGPTNVFLYFTEVNNSSRDDESDHEIIGNRLYKYDFVNNTLINPKLILHIPSKDSLVHIGGKMIIGPDKKLYIAIGDLYAKNATTQNIVNGTPVDGSGGILRLDLEKNSINNDTSDSVPSLRNYFAYGIRNSFGMDFDPITGNLWDTENGPYFGDEVNLVEPGFNSGWNVVQGIWEADDEKQRSGNIFTNHTKLINFNNYGNYSSPEMTWEKTIGITAIKFLNSSNLGNNYQNDMFIGDFNFGNIYHFKLDKHRQSIVPNSTSIDTIETLYGKVPIFHYDPLQQCISIFSCHLESSIDFSKNVKDNMLNISTPLVNEVLWSWIPGKEFVVTPGKEYDIITSMKLGDTVNQSHISIRGFNETIKRWEPLMSCPAATNGPTEWTKYLCNLQVPSNISKIIPYINGGFSAIEGYEGVSKFNGIQIIDRQNNSTVDLFPESFSTPNVFGRGFGHISDIQVGPDGDLYILSVDPDKTEYLETYEKHSESTGAIYKIVKK